jgi:hypothetical protein
MMRVSVEFDLPEGQAIPDPRDIARLTDPNWHADWWHIEDVQEHYAGDGEYITFTEEEAQSVLGLMAKYSSADVGICWDSIHVWQEMIFDERKEETV